METQSTYDARSVVLKEIKQYIERKDPSIHVNLYKRSVLRVPTGKAHLEVQLWIYKKDPSFYMGANGDDDEAKRVLMNIFHVNEELIKKQTGYTFKVNGRKENYIETLIPYDKSKTLEEQIDMFAAEYMKLISIFRNLVSKFKGL